MPKKVHAGTPKQGTIHVFHTSRKFYYKVGDCVTDCPKSSDNADCGGIVPDWQSSGFNLLNTGDASLPPPPTPPPSDTLQP
eukprot:scaffold1542_cov143-Skeletonema_marinoi.AAC.8